MPELPDLEVLRENILKKFLGKKVVFVRARKNTASLHSKIRGKKLVGITRRGKYLVLAFGFTVTDIFCELVLHLMLNGRLVSFNEKEPIGGIDLFVIRFENGEDLRLRDRTFWAKYWVGSDGKLDKLGVEPLSNEFTLDFFKKKLEKSRTKIKPLLMKQEFIAGIGNAYTDEALFDAKIHPKTSANKLDDEKVKKLYNSIKKVLSNGIKKVKEAVGSKIFEDEDRKFMKIYRKASSPCPRCGEKIRMTKVGGRDTFYCPLCQLY
ncbi:MAG: hypothetical protein ACD_63C00115G0006 [uncultured bacterium]|nr:MAG: hypothetical protein ACD_63C00115G0006 [uncultured bacterium]